MIHKLNGVVININAQHTIGGVTYPAGTLANSPEKWVALGITEEADAPIPISQLVSAKLLSVDNLYRSKLYSNVDVAFPAGIKTVQLRNQDDMLVLQGRCSAALALVSNGIPNTQVVYRTADNVNQTLTAQQMVDIGLSIMNAKSSMASVAWGHKDAIRLLELAADTAGVVAYDITVGW